MFILPDSIKVVALKYIFELQNNLCHFTTHANKLKGLFYSINPVLNPSFKDF